MHPDTLDLITSLAAMNNLRVYDFNINLSHEDEAVRLNYSISMTIKLVDIIGAFKTTFRISHIYQLPVFLPVYTRRNNI